MSSTIFTQVIALALLDLPFAFDAIATRTL
jgi:hypothetical protein